MHGYLPRLQHPQQQQQYQQQLMAAGPSDVQQQLQAHLSWHGAQQMHASSWLAWQRRQEEQQQLATGSTTLGAEHTLLQAARSGNLHSLRAALAAGEPGAVHVRGAEGETVAHWAAQGGHLECLETLLRVGAAPDAANVWGDTPCHLAAAAGEHLCLRVLLASGADRNAVNSCNGYTPLHMAAEGGHMSCVEALLQGGASACQPCSAAGATAGHLAAYGGFVAVLQALLSAHADVEAADFEGRTLLHWAAAGGCLPAVQCLVRAGAEVTAVDSQGCTPRQLATAEGRTAVAWLLRDLEQKTGAAPGKWHTFGAGAGQVLQDRVASGVWSAGGGMWVLST